MKLEKVLKKVNNSDINKFVDILNGFTKSEENKKIIKEILGGSTTLVKTTENEKIVQVFNLFQKEYTEYLKSQMNTSDFQLDVVLEILVRDGNQVIPRAWFWDLYERQSKQLNEKIQSFNELLELDKPSKLISASRLRDYKIFYECVKAAYFNDDYLDINERIVLKKLSEVLNLSSEEEQIITYSTTGILDHTLNETENKLIEHLKAIGVVLYKSRQERPTFYIPDEIVSMLREILEIQVTTKYVRRVFRHLSDAEVNSVASNHSVRGGTRPEKIDRLLAMGLNFTKLLSEDIYPDGTKKPEKFERVLKLITEDLEIKLDKTGRTLEERISFLVNYFNGLQGSVLFDLTKDGYNTLFKDLQNNVDNIDDLIKTTFELRPHQTLSTTSLIDHGISPRDLIYLLSHVEQGSFCKEIGAKFNGNRIQNILDQYVDIDDLKIENYELIGHRDLEGLLQRGIEVKSESNLGLLYEEVTETILSKLGFEVDNVLKNKVNRKSDKIDLLINLGNDEVIIVECKTIEKLEYNAAKSVLNQVKPYAELCVRNKLKVKGVVIVSHDFTKYLIDEAKDCFAPSVSLITSKSLKSLADGVKKSKLGYLSPELLVRPGLISSKKVLEILNK